VINNGFNNRINSGGQTLKGPRKIAIANKKGGVGKTTTTINLGSALAKLGRKVLIVDGDLQGSLTSWLNLGDNVNGRDLGAILTGIIPFVDAIFEIEEENFFAIPIDNSLNELKLNFNGDGGWEMALKRELDNWPLGYDYILFDCPASYNAILINILAASDEIIIPVQTEILSLNSTLSFLENLSQIKQSINPTLEIAGILPVMFDKRTRHSKEILEIMAEAPNLGNHLFKTVIRNNIRLAEGPMRSRTIFRASPSSNGAVDYMLLAEELIDQENNESNDENIISEVAISSQSENNNSGDALKPPEF